MRQLLVLAAISLVLAPACGKSNGKDKGGNTTTTSNGSRDSKSSNDVKKAPKMTNTDTSPEAWKQAEAIAAKDSVGELEKRSDALPFMFMADAPPAVLVHNGAVVKEKGAAAAGSYLRDLGIVDSTGPGIEDVLFVLFSFDAWPPVKEIDPQHFINQPDDPSAEEITARIDIVTDAAHVVLHYWLPEPEPSPEDAENDVGSVDPNFEAASVRPILRATLVIPKTGDAAWKPVEKLNWAM